MITAFPNYPTGVVHDGYGGRFAMEESIASGTTTPGLGTPGGDPLVQHLRELERNLTTLKAGYKESYPDIVQVKQEIESVSLGST